MKKGILYTQEQVDRRIKSAIRKSNKAAKERGRQQGLVQGICLVVADIVSGYSVREAWSGAGMSLDECKKYKVDIHDLSRIEANIDKLE